ncbi:hypothetical protein [Actinacidiphila glaucinigra]|uniref:hypothetical protein n=1 Tax=Actinacidiphila glaucinigra TaxID=235986 RepID=UPI003D94CB61
MGYVVFKGTAVQVADQIEHWFTFDACDGFMLVPPVIPIGLERSVDLVIPELQRRGLFRTEYVGSTPRERMGLDIPHNPYFSY